MENLEYKLDKKQPEQTSQKKLTNPEYIKKSTYSPEEEKQITERLRDLGYL